MARKARVKLPGYGLKRPAGGEIVQLTSLIVPETVSPPARTVSYAMDPLNRRSVNDNGVVTNYTPNGLNQYTALTGHAPGYDSNFNLTAYDSLTYTFDAEKRLLSVAGNGQSAQMVYDGLGRCLKRTLNGVVTIQAYDGWKPIMDWAGNGTWSAWNIYGAGADEILYRNQSNIGLLIYHYDIHGNVTFLLNASGGLVERYTYDAFGKVTIMDQDLNPRAATAYGNRFLFQGREWFPQLGIYDYRHRVYHPELGRFLQMDPMGFGAGDMNLFRYCEDDPVDGSDPTGMIPEQSYSGVVDVSFDSGLGGMSRDRKLQSPAYAGNLSFGNVDVSSKKGGGEAARKSRYGLKLIPLEPGDPHGHYIAQRLQIMDSGYPLADDELSVKEHVIRKDPQNSKSLVLITSENKLISATRKGVLTDRIGLETAPRAHANEKYIADFGATLYQRGTRIGTISSTFRHITNVTNGNVENTVIPLLP